MEEAEKHSETVKRPSGVEAVERALQILETCAAQPKGISLAELARCTGFYKSTILRIAVSLEKFRYLQRDTGSVFRLGPAAWHLGRQYDAENDLETRIRPELKRLCRATRETASYYVRVGDNRVCLLREEPDRAIRHTVSEGTKLPLGLGASGRILSAEPGIEDVILSLGERDPDLAAIAIAIRNQAGEVIAALALSGPITRFSERERPALANELGASQQRLSAVQLP